MFDRPPKADGLQTVTFDHFYGPSFRSSPNPNFAVHAMAAFSAEFDCREVTLPLS